MEQTKKFRATDLERLGRLNTFSWLAPPELKVLSASLEKNTYSRGEVIFYQSEPANDARVLVAGIARITCLNADHQRATIALIAPGLIPELPSAAMMHFDFRCEAYNECRVGTLDWKAFDRITPNGSQTAFRKFHENDLKYWYRLMRRSSGLLNDLHERIALTMLDLCEDFGIEDSRGTLLPFSISHKDIASLVGATRPRITEHLGQMERDHLLLRQGRQFIVNTTRLANSLAARPAERLPLRWPRASNGAIEAASCRP
jgi:CRP-like cAMP-binding protein